MAGYNSTNVATTDIQKNFGLATDGIYGNQTTQAVKNFQLANGLTGDGIFGANTLAAYNTKFGNGAINQAQLNGGPAMQIIPQNPDTTNYAGITGGVTQQVIDSYKALNDQYTKATTDQQTAGNDIINQMNSLLGKTADTQAANEVAGVNTATADLNKYVQQLADLNSQASSLNREAQAIPLQTQENNRNTGATDRGVAPQDAGALRMNALKALSIGQQADIASAAATGSQLRLNAAKDKAQQIVDLKYKPLEDALAIKEKQYELNKDVLSSLDKKRTEALGIALEKEKQDLQDAKKEEESIQNMIVEAAPYAPKSVIDMANNIAKNGGSASDVARAIGQYGGDYLKNQLLTEQIKTEKTQRANINANINKTNAEIASLNAPGGGKPPTDTQVQSAGYADRIGQANAIIDSKADTFKNMSYTQFKLAESNSLLANSVLSPDVRQAAQAMRNFITAKLRKESGASISPTEFADARLQYFPSLNDDPTTLANKKALRDSVLSNLIVGSGSAYTGKSTTPDNPFSQSLGGNIQFQGTSILTTPSNGGGLNFVIPKI